jgi:sodium-dependent dicarboxylate transporter 2/3/5
VAIAAALLVLARTAGLPGPAAWTAAITALCAVWWVLEPIPIPATSILPFTLFPFAGVLTDREVATAYGHPMILLLLGGFILSTAMERNRAHRRLAHLMLRLTGGGSGRRVVLGFMLATAVCSMWISNTATALMMLPVALAVLEQEDTERLRVPLLLGIAYGASIGGIGTPIGTPPNIIFMAVYRETTGVQIGFASWMLIGVPAALLLLPAAWLRLTWHLRGGRAPVIPGLGPWRKPERRVLLMFGLTALAWITRSEPAGGWSGLLGLPGVGDSTVALLAVSLMFLVPNGEGEPLLDWNTARKIPWGLLLLFGGGIAIARAFGESGLSAAIGDAMVGISVLPLVLTMLLLCLCVTFLTEVTSNTATTTLLLPILAAAAFAVGVDPMLYMVPATLSASCAFMLPVATPPNAVVFGADLFSLRRMAREGFALNLVGAVLLTGWCFWILPRFGGN